MAINFSTPEVQWLSQLTLEQARKYLSEGHFGAGSMAPKISAVISCLEQGGGRAVITSPELMVAALRGEAGTTIVA